MNITLLIVLALLSLMPNLSKYPFKGEESLRTIVAFEMWYSKSYFQPTFLGEPYFNKPPLFNWLIIAYSHTFPWSEITGRAVSLTFLFLTTLAVGLFSYNLFKKVNLSLLSSLIFLTFGNVLFFYGYLAEIDITFTFFVFGGMISLYLWQRGAFSWAILSGIIFGLSALLKGLPAYAFLTFSLFAFAIYNWNLKALLNKGTALIYLISLVIPLLWLLQTPEPLEYLKNLWRESLSRVIGNIHIPDSLWNKKEQGFFLEIETRLERRLKNILEEYTAFEGWLEEVKSSIGKIRRVRGKVWWAKRRRKIVRRDYGKVVEFEEVKYGMLMMVLCDREGRIYDVWISFGSMHEVRAFRERKKRSVWFRELVESCVVYGDRGYRGCEGVIVCGSREMRAKRQVVEGVISQIKLFNAGSGWRTLTCVLVYVYAYAIGYSYYRRGELEV